MATENGIDGYINYKVWQFLNKFKERHRQKKLKEYLIRGAQQAARKHLANNPEATYSELKEIVTKEMETLRWFAEGKPQKVYYSKDTVRKLLSEQQAKVFIKYVDGCSKGKKPTQIELSDETKKVSKRLLRMRNGKEVYEEHPKKPGVSTRTIRRWIEGWRAIPILKDVLEEAEEYNRKVNSPIYGKALYGIPGSTLSEYYGTSLRFDRRKTFL